MSYTQSKPRSSDGNDNQQDSSRLQAVQELGQPAPPPKLEGDIHCLPIIGQVEGHVLLPAKNKTTKYEHVIPQLVAVEQNPAVRGLLVILNTVGGDIEAGLAIAEMIRSLSKPTVSLVLGGGHSIGCPIAVAAHRSFIAPTATITIHPIRLTGLVIGVPQTYEYLDKMQDRVIRFVIQNSKMTEQALRELMFRTGDLVRDVGSVLIGPEAVQSGLIDDVGGLAEACRYLRRAIAETGPQPQNVFQGPGVAAGATPGSIPYNPAPPEFAPLPRPGPIPGPAPTGPGLVPGPIPVPLPPGPGPTPAGPMNPPPYQGGVNQ